MYTAEQLCPLFCLIDALSQSEDNTGCTDDLTVVSKSTVDRLAVEVKRLLNLRQRLVVGVRVFHNGNGVHGFLVGENATFAEREFLVQLNREGIPVDLLGEDEHRIVCSVVPKVIPEQTGAATPGGIGCPNCGEAGALQHREDAVICRDLLRVDENGGAVFDSQYEVFDEDGKHPRIGCKNCGAEYPVSETTRLRFV